MDVLGMGAVAMDIILNCEQLPREDGYAVIKKETAMPGGSCANVITDLAGLGTKTGFIARLGDDKYGKVLKADFKACGVSTQHLSVKKNGVSMHCYVAVSKNGTKIIFCNMGDSLLSLTEQDVHPKMLFGIKAFYTAMQPCSPALKLARICRKKGIPILCNLQVEPEFLEQCNISMSQVEEMLSISSLIITFKSGLIRHTGISDIYAASEFLYEKYHPEMGLVTTLGEHGAIWHKNRSVIQTPAFNIKSVDTTGAGDAFIAGLVHSILSLRTDSASAIKFASACAALKCTRHGPRLNAGEKEIHDFIRKHETL